MRYWFSGLVNGLEAIDESARSTVLRECGKACAESYTAGVFREAKRQSADIETFLTALGISFPEATYEMLTPRTIRARYSHCSCDLVSCGLIESPSFCECSAHNLQENLERALEIAVTVTLESSILRGSTECVFLAVLDAEKLERADH